MTQPVQVSLQREVTNGSLTVFNYNFKIIDESELVLYLKPTGGVEAVVNSSLYTVSGEGNESGGAVTFTTAPVAGTLALDRKTPVNNETVVPAEGTWDRTSLERQFDDTTRQIQDLKSDFDLRGVKVESTDNADTIDAESLLGAADEAEASAVAAKASEDAATAAASVATGVASTIQDDADAAVVAATNTLVPPAVTTEVDAQVPPAVDSAVNTAIIADVIPAGEAAGEQAAIDYMDANLNPRVDVRVEQVAADQVADEVADQVPPAVQSEVERVVEEEVIDIQQSQAQELVDDAYKDRQRDTSYSQAMGGGIISIMQIVKTVVVPPKHRLTLFADSIASGAEIIAENGSEVVSPNIELIELVQKIIPAEVEKITLQSVHANKDMANTTTTLNGTLELFIDAIYDVEWDEGDTLRFINVGLADCSIEAETDVVFIPAGPHIVAPENQIMFELIDKINNKWFVTVV